MVSTDTKKEIMLLQEYVDYGIEMYCMTYGITNDYKCNVLDDEMKHIQSISADKCLRVDFTTDIIKELENSKYFYLAKGEEKQLYILVDAHRMKIYVYDGERAIVDKYEIDETYDLQAFENNFELEDCVVSDWSDVLEGEYWVEMRDKMEHLTIPEDVGWNWEMYGKVAYIIERYCSENAIEEMFYFDAEEDVVGHVTNMVYTVRVQSKERMLYIDIDGRRYKYHVYEVKPNNAI